MIKLSWRYKKVLLFLMFFIIIHLTCVNIYSQNINIDKDIFVTINGQKVLFKDVFEPISTIYTRFLNNYDYKPSTIEFLLYYLNISIFKYKFRIKEIFFNELSKKHNIEVTDEEIIKYQEQFFNIENEKEFFEEIKKQRDNLVNALERVLNNPEEEREIYILYVSSFMSYKLWKRNKQIHNSFEKIENFKKDFPTNKKEFFLPTKETTRIQLLYKKQVDLIVGDIKITEEEVNKYLEATKYYDDKEFVRHLLMRKKKQEKLSGFLNNQYINAEKEFYNNDAKRILSKIKF